MALDAVLRQKGARGPVGRYDPWLTRCRSGNQTTGHCNEKLQLVHVSMKSTHFRRF
jgi:hypothetical protein